MFGEMRFVIREPLSIDRVTRVTLPVVRLGDTSLPAVVRVYTRDGTARAAKDYIGFSKGPPGFDYANFVIDEAVHKKKSVPVQRVAKVMARSYGQLGSSKIFFFFFFLDNSKKNNIFKK